MDFELFIIIALIIVFLVSCCGLIQKIRENYEEDRGRVISVTQIHVPNQLYSNNAYQTGSDELSSGVFPSTLAPPPYIDASLHLEHMEPPPRYEDLIKETQYTVIQMGPNPGTAPQVVHVHQNETGAQSTDHLAPTRTTANQH